MTHHRSHGTQSVHTSRSSGQRTGLRRISLVGVAVLLLTLLLPLQTFAQSPGITLQPSSEPAQTQSPDPAETDAPEPSPEPSDSGSPEPTTDSSEPDGTGLKEGESCSDGTGVVRDGVCRGLPDTPSDSNSPEPTSPVPTPTPTPRPTSPKEERDKDKGKDKGKKDKGKDRNKGGDRGDPKKCRLDVSATRATWGKGPYFRHLFVVYTDPTGAQHHYEALPANYPSISVEGQLIKTEQGAGPTSIVGSTSDGPTTVTSGSAACGKNSNGEVVSGFDQEIIQGPHACFLDQMSRIERAAVRYHTLSTNSNAFVWTILHNCNITPRKPTSDDRQTPGWGKLLIINEAPPPRA